MNAVERHPQRQQIIDLIIGGTKLRQIARQVDPPVHHSSLARFRLQLLNAASASVRGVTPERKQLKSLIASAGGQPQSEDSAVAMKDAVRQELQKSIEAERLRIDRWRADAETSQHVHPITGEVQHNMDHGALARHTRNKLSTLELSAKLSGLLQDSSTGGATIRAVVLMPAPGDPASSTPAEPGRLAVEIDLKR